MLLAVFKDSSKLFILLDRPLGGLPNGLDPLILKLFDEVLLHATSKYLQLVRVHRRGVEKCLRLDAVLLKTLGVVLP